MQKSFVLLTYKLRKLWVLEVRTLCYLPNGATILIVKKNFTESFIHKKGSFFKEECQNSTACLTLFKESRFLG